MRSIKAVIMVKCALWKETRKLILPYICPQDDIKLNGVKAVTLDVYIQWQKDHYFLQLVVVRFTHYQKCR